MSGQRAYNRALSLTLAFLFLGMSASMGFQPEHREELEIESNSMETHSDLNLPGSTIGSVHSLTAIGAAYNYTCVVMDNNGMKCWGKGGTGYLGNGDSNTEHTPVSVNMPAENAAEMSGAGGHHTCLIGSNSSFYCWGEDWNGQIGHSHYSCGGWCEAPHGPSTLGGKAALTIVTGIHHTCGIAVDLTLYCWGKDADGQLGNGDTTGNQHTPQNIDLPTGRTAVSINAAVDTTCVILDNGSGMCWGRNMFGHLGDGTYNSRTSPTPISVLPANRSLVALDIGGMHTCGILDDGLVYCWGDNSHGQFGDGTNNSSTYPRAASLPPGRTAISIDAGTFHTCAILDDSSAYCWGINTYGELGDGTTNNSTTPVSVQMPSGLGVAEITTGNKHSCAVATNASVYCWGAHGEGALGLGEGNDSDIPAFVDLGTGRHALMGERDNDDDGIVHIFDPFPDGCPVGTYASGGTCVESDPGWYADGIHPYEQFPCPPGSFQPNSGQSNCIPTNPGYFVNETSAIIQNPCPPGSYQPDSGQTTCLLTDPGNFSSSETSTFQTQCPSGEYQPNHSSTGCIDASPGNFVQNPGAHQQTPCPPGQYQPMWGSTSCFNVNPGYQSPTEGSSTQEPCDPGTYSDSIGQPECSTADPGYIVTGSQQTSQEACSAGQYQPNSGQISCLTVDEGHYTETEGTANQIPCEPGTYQPATGQTSCLPADAGSFAPIPGSTSQTQCSAGTFSSETGQANCTQADPGSYVGLDGMTGQLPCPTGEYQDAVGSDGCKQPPPGQIANPNGTSTAPCEPGTYVDGGTCTTASPGYFVNESGALEQTKCSPGYYQSEAGQTECIPAAPGEHVPSEGAWSAEPCQPGQYQDTSAQSSCKNAKAGQYVPGEGFESPRTCQTGEYQDTEGSSSCKAAEPGHFTNQNVGAVNQTACPPGKYQPNSKKNFCLDAEPGHYVSEAGATEQLSCPSGQSQQLSGQSSCVKPDTPIWLTILMYAVPAVVGGTLAIMYLTNKKKNPSKSRDKAYMYSEDMRKR